MAEGPCVLYISDVMYKDGIMLSDDRMDPPIHAEYFLSGGAMTFTVH